MLKKTALVITPLILTPMLLAGCSVTDSVDTTPTASASESAAPVPSAPETQTPQTTETAAPTLPADETATEETAPSGQIETIEGFPVYRVPADATTVEVPVGTILIFEGEDAILADAPDGLMRSRSSGMTDNMSILGLIFEDDETGAGKIDELEGNWIAETPGEGTFSVNVSWADDQGKEQKTEVKEYTIIVK